MATHKDGILDAVISIVKEKGIGFANTREIAKQAGCAEATLYKHYGDKTSLMLAAVNHYSPLPVESLSIKVAGKGSLLEKFEEIAGELIRCYEDWLPVGAILLSDKELAAKQAASAGGGPLVHLPERVQAYCEMEMAAGRLRKSLNFAAVGYDICGSCLQYALWRDILGDKPSGIGRGTIKERLATQWVQLYAVDSVAKAELSGESGAGKKGKKK